MLGPENLVKLLRLGKILYKKYWSSSELANTNIHHVLQMHTGKTTIEKHWNMHSYASTSLHVDLAAKLIIIVWQSTD